MMLFLRGLPSGAFEKIQFDHVVLTRISRKIWCGDGIVVRDNYYLLNSFRGLPGLLKASHFFGAAGWFHLRWTSGFFDRISCINKIYETFFSNINNNLFIYMANIKNEAMWKVSILN